MSAIDEIMAACDAVARSPYLSKLHGKNLDALYDLITAALAEARREGAEAMRADCSRLARRNPLHYGSGEPAEEELAQAIEDLPLPTGEREAVRLTNDQIAAATRHLYASDDAASMGAADDIETARAIEAAVLAINGLEVRR